MKYRETIGIVGGMGSYATLDLFRRLLDAFPAEKEWDRPRILIDNRCTMPSRVRAILYQEERPALISELAASAKGLINCGADILVFACNTSHVFLEDVFRLVPEAKSKTIHLIETLSKQMAAAGICDVRLLATEGTIESGIYQSFFEPRGITLSVPAPAEYAKIRQFIEGVKQNRVDENMRDAFKNFCDSQLSNHIVIGCTELPILATGYRGDKILWDPLESVIQQIHKIVGAI